ncbi:MAG: hypothetical protein SGARI_000533 [Bacillariaceae sp.]
MALYDQATHLVNTFDLMPHQRAEVFWRTGTSKEALNPDTMWRRANNVVKEVEKLAEQMEAFSKEHSISSSRSAGGGGEGKDKSEHEQLYRAFLQKEFEGPSGVKKDPFPLRWEFTHNHTLVTYKMYYNKGSNLDKTFPAPQHREIVLPQNKPAGGWDAYNGPGPARSPAFPHQPPAAAAVGTTPSSLPQDNRMQMLKEVREHMDLLKHFEGVVDAESLNKRKRELFAAMPPAPPAHDANKKPRADMAFDV